MSPEQADKIVKSIEDLTIAINSLALSNQVLIDSVLKPSCLFDDDPVDFDDEKKGKSTRYLDGTKI